MTSGQSIARRQIAKRIGAATLFLGLSLAIGGTAAAQSLSAAPQSNIQGFYDSLLSVMKPGRTLGQNGRYAQLAPVLQRLFDLPYMTQLAVGPSWGSMTASQQRQVTDAFGRYLGAVYADRFDTYSGERFQVLGERAYGSDIIVDTRIVKSNGEPVTISYLMRRRAGAWQVTDIYLDGTISQMATQRSEFYSILRQHGVDGLIAALNHKADRLLGAGFAASS